MPSVLHETNFDGAVVVITLIFPVPALYLLMNPLLHLSLQDSSPRGFVVVGDFEDVGSVDPIVAAPAHDMVGWEVKLIDGDLEHPPLVNIGRHEEFKGACTLLYVAL